MQIKALLDDDDAVSPVIGVILMVAITVILAAVIASFVLGLGEDAASTTPQASFSFDYSNTTSGNDALEVTHESGDTIDGSNVGATVTGAENDGSGSPTYDGANLFGSDEVSAGSTGTIDDNAFSGVNQLSLAPATVRVTYNDPSNDQSSTLQTWTGPDA
jgi:flagellin-like protein